MPKKDLEVLALLVADVHLCERPPLARASEPDWFEAMARQLDQLKELQALNDVCPVLVAGDLFDKHNPSPTLINFALDHLPDEELYAIPGQHDLPYHGLDRITQTAYHTLVASGWLRNLDPSKPEQISDRLLVQGVPWGSEIPPGPGKQRDVISLALIHATCWMKGADFPNAPKQTNLSAYSAKLQGYDVAVFGDNHKPFQVRTGDCFAYNAGSFMRRTIDQEDHKPSIGMLLEDGTITRHYLDISQECFEARSEQVSLEADPRLLDFLHELAALEVEGLDFVSAVRIALQDARQELQDFVGQVLEDAGST